MTLSPALRWVLVATLAVSGVLALQSDEDSAAVPLSKHAAPASPARPAAPRIEQSWPAPPTRNPAWAPPASDALAAWGPPPPAPDAKPLQQAPTAPQSPVFPYTLIGRLEDAGVAHALLSGPLRTIDARVGDLIDGQWRVEAVLPNGVELVWVPGGQRQLVSYRTTT